MTVRASLHKPDLESWVETLMRLEPCGCEGAASGSADGKRAIKGTSYSGTARQQHVRSAACCKSEGGEVRCNQQLREL